MFNNLMGGSPANKQAALPASAPVYDELVGLVRAADAQRKRKADEASETDALYQSKIDGLNAFNKTLQADRAELVSSYNAKGQNRSQEAEDDFWIRIADLDGLIQRTTEQIDDARLKMYFPSAKGYTYRFAAGGAYIAVGDFVVSSMRGKLIMEAVPGRGECWVPGPSGGSPPGIRVKASPISLSILLTDLGIRSDQANIPPALRHIRELELSVEVDILLPLAFTIPPRTLDGSTVQGQGQGPKVGPSGRGINSLAKFQWQLLPQFKFEVTKLDCRTRSSMPVPTTLLKALINSIAPPYIQAGIVGLMPQELGMLLALHGDHLLNAAGEVTISSIPLEVLHAPLDSAVDSGLMMSQGQGARTGGVSVQGQAQEAEGAQQPMPHMKIAAAGVKSLLADASSGQTGLLAAKGVSAFGGSSNSPGLAAIPAQLAAKSARALGLTPTQARAFVCCQMSTPAARGVPLLRSAQDIINFLCTHNPNSVHRRAQASASGPGSTVTGIAGQTRGGVSAGMDEEMAWDRMCELLQRLLDEYVQAALAAAMDNAASVNNRMQAKALAATAHSRAMSSLFNVRDLFAAAEQLYRKPVALHVQLHDLLVRVHAETAVGLAKAIGLRLIRAKQKATTATSGKAAGGGSRPLTNGTATGGASSTPTLSRSGVTTAGSGSAGVTPAGTGAKDSSLSAKELAAKDASSGPASLVLQAAAVADWAHEVFGNVRLVHGFVTRVTASTSGWLLGGPRGKLTACVRQLQLECAPGVCLPLSVGEGFFAPGTVVTAMEGRDERSEALAWAAAGAQGGRPVQAQQGGAARAGVPAQSRTGTGDAHRGRGTFNIMLCWPKKDRVGLQPSEPRISRGESFSSGPGAGSVPYRASDASDRIGRASTSEVGGGVGGSSLDAALAAVAEDGVGSGGVSTPARPGMLSSTTSYSAEGQGQGAALLTPADVEVMATVKVHRAWAGLRIDEAALLSMVHRRAEAQSAGLVDLGGTGRGKGLPPLHSLELSFRPGLFGSSFTPHGPVSLSQLESAASARRRGGLESPLALLGGTRHEHGGDAPPMPFFLGVETPVWTRFCVEVQALEASGDVPVLAKELGSMFEKVFAAAEAEAKARDDDDEGEVDVGEASREEDGYEGGMLRRGSITAPSMAPQVGGGASELPDRKGSVSASSDIAVAAEAVVEALIDQGQSGQDSAEAVVEAGATAVVAAPLSARGASDTMSVASSSLAASAAILAMSSPSPAPVAPAVPVTVTPITREVKDARRKHALERKVMAQAARGVASAEASARLNRYLRSEDLRLAVNLFLSVLSVPAAPIAGVDDMMMGLEAEPGARRPPPLDPVLQDIAGLDRSPAGEGALAAAAAQHAAAGRQKVLMRKVLSFSVSSRHAMQPSMVPTPGSALLAIPTAPSSVHGSAAPARPAQAPSAPVTGSSDGCGAPTPVLLVHEQGQTAGAGMLALSRGGGAPVLTAPAVAIDVTLSLLTLLEDIAVVRSALDTAGALQ